MSAFVKVGAHHVRPGDVAAVSAGRTGGFGEANTRVLMRSGEALSVDLAVDDVVALLDPDEKPSTTMHWGAQP